MGRKKLLFALQHTKPDDWSRFEALASSFLADQYPQLRTVAGTGDGGRDAILWQQEGDPLVVLQYSIARDWNGKIRSTAERLKITTPNAKILIYVTSQQIGPAADKVRAFLSQRYNLHLDIRDASWFADRVNRSPATIEAAEEYAVPIVEPLLVDSDLIRAETSGHSDAEARAALVFLTMQWEDESREKGLTKLSYEALVRSALRGTDNDNRMTRDEICGWVRAVLQHSRPEDVDQYTIAALTRMRKRQIRHWEKEDEFCLTYDERERLKVSLIELGLLDTSLDSEIRDTLANIADANDIFESTERLLEKLTLCVRHTIASYLLERGNAFVESLSSGQSLLFTSGELMQKCADYFESNSQLVQLPSEFMSLVVKAVERLLNSSSEGSRRYLRALSESYTLFAFLQQVPDVQRVVRKMSSRVQLWLDTSAVLPIMAETLVDPEKRSHTNTLEAARQIGMRLYVTPGVIEEVDHHIQRAQLCVQLGSRWRGDTPFLLAIYLMSGLPLEDFKSWTTDFVGSVNPEDDLAEFLREAVGAERRSLSELVASAPNDLRWAVERYWDEVHQSRRRTFDGTIQPEAARRLAQHDVENYLGVVMARRTEDRTLSWGHEYWWLTLDRSAYRATEDICRQENLESFDPPVMSYDFLTNYVAVSPDRSSVSETQRRLLPVMIDMGRLHEIPSDIIEIATSIREEFRDRPERVIRREIRDRSDRAMLELGARAYGGIEAIETGLMAAVAETGMRP